MRKICLNENIFEKDKVHFKWRTNLDRNLPKFFNFLWKKESRKEQNIPWIPLKQITLDIKKL